MSNTQVIIDMPPKETPVLLEERVISNRGLIIWTPDATYRRFWVQCELVREPRINFVNKKFNPERSDYANIIFLRENQVIREEVMNFERQTFVFDPDPTGYIAKALHCWFASAYAQLGAIATAVGVTLVPGDPVFCEPIEDQFDQILFSVRVDGALGVQLYGLKYDLACPESEQEPQPPPPPPDFPNFPPGTPLADTDAPASPPYSPPNDDGNTNPLPEDVATPPPDPGSGECVKYIVNIRVFGNFDPNPFVTSRLVWGVVGELKLSNPSAGEFTTVQLLLECQGSAEGTTPCGEPQDFFIISAQRRDFTSWEITSIEEP